VAVLQASQAVPSDVTIALVDDDKMRELNRRHANIDETTDVLSFESGAIDPETGRLILGDIVICLPVAREQADEAGHSLEDELALLTVHGVLHLLGYDHADAEGRRQMWDRQAAVLHELGHTAVAR
jgi:probable rRNA maturation factor